MMPLTVLRAADGRRMPWKNGGGETLEIAVHPPGADLDRVDWRVSLATVATDGPFSRLPRLDRTLTVIQGEGLELSIGRQDPVGWTRPRSRCSFRGRRVHRALVSGPVTDLT